MAAMRMGWTVPCVDADGNPVTMVVGLAESGRVAFVTPGGEQVEFGPGDEREFLRRFREANLEANSGG